MATLEDDLLAVERPTEDVRAIDEVLNELADQEA
jgi:hypothetical protein